MATTHHTHPVPSVHSIIDNVRRHKALAAAAAVAIPVAFVIGVAVSAIDSSGPASNIDGATESVVAETFAPTGPAPLLLDGNAFDAAVAEAVGAVSIPTSRPVSVLLDAEAFDDAVVAAVAFDSAGFNDAIERIAAQVTAETTIPAVLDDNSGSERSVLLDQAGFERAIREAVDGK